MSTQREHDKNVSVFMRGMCRTQRKIVNNIFKCNIIIFLCSGKYFENVQRQIPKHCIYNLRNIIRKMETVTHCY